MRYSVNGELSFQRQNKIYFSVIFKLYVRFILLQRLLRIHFIDNKPHNERPSKDNIYFPLGVFRYNVETGQSVRK